MEIIYESLFTNDLLTLGYLGTSINKGNRVDIEDAFEFACLECGITGYKNVTLEFKNMLVEWFFSNGCWVEIYKSQEI